MKHLKSPVFALILALSSPCLYAVLSKSAATTTERFHASDAVFRGVVASKQSFKNNLGRIETRYTIRVEESLKGRLPASLSIFLPGGTVEGASVDYGCQPNLRLGEDRLFFVNRGPGGRLGLNPGSAPNLFPHTPQAELLQARTLSLTFFEVGTDVTDQAASGGIPLQLEGVESAGTTNLFTDGTYGFPARFLGPDRGEPIPYLVDADYLPAGISLNTALTAVSNALASWKKVAFLDFRFDGLASFGTSAVDVDIDDGRLRIQLHNSYGEITSSSTLGVGGRSMSLSVLGNGWTSGGRVFANDFHHTTRGYVVLNHTSSSMQNTLTFEEVLCHEIGHALGMAHSSEDVNEPTSSPAYQAIMYYQVHADGRGASPRDWDINVIQQSHPTNNSPPYSFNRMMDITTAAVAPAIPGINEILLSGDLQTTTLTAHTYDPTLPGNGTFSLTGTLLKYTPASFWAAAARLDPEGNSSRGKVDYRLSDGTHASPWARVRVLSFSPDTKPSGAIDGVPDNWMVANFGNADPAAGPKRGANDDNDGDGLRNRDEYRSWMVPTLPSSAQRLTASSDGTVSWQGKAYELYELWASTNFTDWFFVQALVPTNDTPTVKVNPGTSHCAAYRVLKTP